MKFNYVPLPIFDLVKKQIVGQVFTPLVPIMLSVGHEISKTFFNCLLDSGSDFNLFPAKLGELMHLSITKGKRKEIHGIGDSVIIAYTHQVKLYLGPTYFLTNVDFAYGQTTPLLGRDGFFDHFKTISFNEKEKFIELLQ